jgi:hypothetical protein
MSAWARQRRFREGVAMNMRQTKISGFSKEYVGGRNWMSPMFAYFMDSRHL